MFKTFVEAVILPTSKRNRKSKVKDFFNFFCFVLLSFFGIAASYRTLKSILMWEIEPRYKVMFVFLIFSFKSIQLPIDSKFH